MEDDEGTTPPEPPASLDEARQRRGRTKKEIKESDSKKLRKDRLSGKEIKAIEKKYGLESDNLPIDRAGHAERVFALAAASGTEILLGTDNRWRIYDPTTGRWLDDDITRFRFNEYVIQVGNLMLHNATILQLKLDADELLAKPRINDEEREKIEKLIVIFLAEATKLRTTQDPVRNVAAAKATEEQQHLVEPSEFDSDKDRILVRNGIIDLRTGKLIPHGPQHKFTRWINLDYDLKTKAPTFDTFIRYVLPDDEVREWVQRWAGYVMTGYVDDQLITILLGATGTGKSSLVKLLARTLGSVGHHGYARKVPEGLFRKNMSHWGDTARLIGTRFAYDSEFEQDTVLNAERIRVLTGEDEIDGNEKMRAYKYFDLLAKFMVSTNTMPPMSSRDPVAVREATLRRLAIVPMNEALLDRWGPEELPGLFADLYGEKAGILAWMVAGAKAWYEHGSLSVDLPSAMQNERDSYAKESGITDLIEAAIRVAGYELNQALTCWTEDLHTDIGGDAVVSSKRLSDWLDDHNAPQGGRKRKPGETGAKATRKGIGKPTP